MLRHGKITKERKCIKCGHTKEATEYYKGSGNTCKKCMGEAQKIRNAQKRLAEKEPAGSNMEQRLRYNYTRADVWVSGMQVMSKGILLGEEGKDWWAEKITRHRAWLRWKRKKEEKC